MSLKVALDRGDARREGMMEYNSSDGAENCHNLISLKIHRKWGFLILGTENITSDERTYSKVDLTFHWARRYLSTPLVLEPF